MAEIDNDGHQHQCQHHQQTLEEVRPADGGEAAEEGVRHDDEQEHQHSRVGGDLREQGAEHRGARHQSGRHVDGVGKQEDQRTDQLQRAGVHRKAVGQVLGHGDGVIRRLGERAEAAGAEDPVGGGAQGKTDADPHLTEAEGEDRAGEPHQQPCGHIRCLRGQSRDPRPHGTAA